MNTRIIMAAIAGIISLSGLALESGSEYKYDFEQSAEGVLPKGYRQIKDRWCGGTFEIIDDECGGLKKALKIVKPDEKKTIRILMDRRPRIRIKTGDRVILEFSVKAAGRISAGYYAFAPGEVKSEYNAAYAAVKTGEWQKIKMELTVKKPDMAELSPFFQSHTPGAVFSGLKVTIIPKEKP